MEYYFFHGDGEMRASNKTPKLPGILKEEKMTREKIVFKIIKQRPSKLREWLRLLQDMVKD